MASAVLRGWRNLEMGFDPSGVWHEETYDQPQNGFMGAMNILNQFQGQQNFQRNRGEDTLKQILSALSNPNAGVLASSDEAQQILQDAGVNPQAFSHMYQSTPIAQYRQKLSENPDATPEQMAQWGLQTGAEPPTAANSYYLGQLREQGKNE